MSQNRRFDSKGRFQMKAVASILAISSVVIPFTCGAQTPVAKVASVPSAKILAIGRFNARPTPEQLQILSLRWCATGKIDQWFSPQDGNGVVLILNLSSVDEAHAMLGSSPPGQQQLLTFELIPVDLLVPLTRLLPHPAKPAK